MASRSGSRFRALVSAARASLLADARRHEAAKRAEEKRIAAATRAEEKRIADADARAEAHRLAKLSARNDAVDTLTTFLRDLRSQSRHIRVDGDEGLKSRKLVLTVSYLNPGSQEIEVIQRSHFFVSDTAADTHVGLVLKPRKVFKTTGRLRQYLTEELLREVARSVALAEAAKESGRSIGFRKAGRSRRGR
ncbi:MAG TPA: hypothetical protein VFR18_02185, partial [Terriglobia bacterium]|nr:hypothetical protein [Terriglobia bacterium]